MNPDTTSTSFSLEEFFPHPRQKVFAAFATADALARWIAPMDGIPTEISVFNFVPEGRFEITFAVSNEQHHLTGQFMHIEPSDKLSFTWTWQKPAPQSGVNSHVSVSLREKGSGTELTLTHSRLDAPGMYERHREGWIGCFVRLHNFLEGNKK